LRGDLFCYWSEAEEGEVAACFRRARPPSRALRVPLPAALSPCCGGRGDSALAHALGRWGVRADDHVFAGACAEGTLEPADTDESGVSMSRAGISAELFAAGPLRQFVIAFADNVDFRSEVFSYRKEIEVERE
jgi:hypothetical protein